MKRSKGRTAQIKLTVSSEVIAALDHYARVEGLSRSDAARVALYSAPQVLQALGQGAGRAARRAGPLDCPRATVQQLAGVPASRYTPRLAVELLD